MNDCPQIVAKAVPPLPAPSHLCWGHLILGLTHTLLGVAAVTKDK